MNTRKLASTGRDLSSTESSLGQVHVSEGLGAVAGVVLHHVPVARAVVAVGDKPLQPNRPSRRHHRRRDPDLRPESVPEPVREPRARVPVHAGGVDVGLEEGGVAGVLGHDAVRV
eukprot:CAMPEP_0196726718 /NCGR_PEP_ID=MMETSP1091-20130531/7920_1 /TAXON_ID=302021 /ORGANISM="Rhodomonas sp., Strain CCMP768" /LENGTH=114 /DNA_ID=CAMNT_0042069201 /DNA_START=136 /DNA_END=476 /DNA_ORIENTATION=+